MSQTVGVTSAVIVSGRSVLIRAHRGKSVSNVVRSIRGARNEWSCRGSSRINCTRVCTSLGSARIDTVSAWTLYRSSLVRALVRSYVR